MTDTQSTREKIYEERMQHYMRVALLIHDYYEGRVVQAKRCIELIGGRRFPQLDLRKALAPIQKLSLLEKRFLNLYDLHTVEEWQSRIDEVVQLSLPPQTQNTIY